MLLINLNFNSSFLLHIDYNFRKEQGTDMQKIIGYEQLDIF